MVNRKALKRALVVGATGMVGRHLVSQLNDDPRYQSVTCLLRRPPKQHWGWSDMQKIAPVVVDFDQFDDALPYFAVDHVYITLGTTIKTAGSQAAFRRVDFELVHAAAQMAGLQQAESLAFVSSVGADADSKSFYLRVKGEVEDAIFNLKSLNKVTAIRPSLLLGPREEFRLGEQVTAPFLRLLSPLMMGKLAKYRPIHANAVAKQLIDAQQF